MSRSAKCSVFTDLTDIQVVLLDPEDGIIFLRNLRNHLPKTAQHPRTLESAAASMWKLESREV
jgi:hypothetical protein